MNECELFEKFGMLPKELSDYIANLKPENIYEIDENQKVKIGLKRKKRSDEMKLLEKVIEELKKDELDHFDKINIIIFIVKYTNHDLYKKIPKKHPYSCGELYEYDIAKCGQNIIKHGISFNAVMSYMKTQDYGRLIINIPIKIFRLTGDNNAKVLKDNISMDYKVKIFKNFRIRHKAAIPFKVSSQMRYSPFLNEKYKNHDLYIISIVEILPAFRMRLITCEVIKNNKSELNRKLKRQIKEAFNISDKNELNKYVNECRRILGVTDECQS
ncbi:hypothetical protein [Vibrio harveyi]|uniref:hypothetical protein n=1 Tax=Vibrio harveyi TaxID=669 RepID=UPI004068BD69